MTTSTVAALGLGAMGLEIATCLAKGYTVCGYDPVSLCRDRAYERGLNLASSASEAVQDADYIVIAVRNGAQLTDLLFDQDNVAKSMKDGAIVIITSTVGSQAIHEVEKRLVSYGVEVVDAPVSGGPVRAGQGDLLITVGASDEVYERALPLLNDLSSTLVHVGKKAGDGQSMKTVNQLLCGVHIAAAAEALALASQLGLDQEVALEALMGGAAASFMLGDRGPRAIQASRGEQAPVRSRLDIFVKDMGIVTAAAKKAGISVPVASAAEQLYLHGLSRGWGADDDSSIIRAIQPTESER